MQRSESTTAPSTPIVREGGLTIDSEQAENFLQEHFHPAVSDVEEIGAGAWSRCFGFRVGDEELVVRFGQYMDDFVKDRRAYAYHAIIWTRTVGWLSPPLWSMPWKPCV
jgi:hypothetical protein